MSVPTLQPRVTSRSTPFQLHFLVLEVADAPLVAFPETSSTLSVTSVEVEARWSLRKPWMISSIVLRGRWNFHPDDDRYILGHPAGTVAYSPEYKRYDKNLDELPAWVNELVAAELAREAEEI